MSPARSSIRRSRWSIADARGVLAAMAASGLSLPAFAAREGLQVQRLRRWRDRPESNATAKAGLAAFVELGKDAAMATGASRVEIVLRSGRTLRVGETIDPVRLRRLVDVLEHDAGC